MKFYFSGTSNKLGGGFSAFKLINLFLLMVGVVATGEAWGAHFLSFMGAALIAYLAPIVMFPIAIWATMTAWDWPWYASFFLFLWPLTLALFGGGAVFLLTKFFKNRMKQNTAYASSRAGRSGNADAHNSNARQSADIEVEAESVDVHDISEKDKK